MCIRTISPDPSKVNVNPTVKEPATRELCFKILVVVALVLAAIAVIVGVLSLIASRGGFADMNALAKLGVIGSVNSYVMIGGGAALFAIGIIAWACHWRRAAASAAPIA